MEFANIIHSVVKCIVLVLVREMGNCFKCFGDLPVKQMFQKLTLIIHEPVNQHSLSQAYDHRTKTERESRTKTERERENFNCFTALLDRETPNLRAPR